MRSALAAFLTLLLLWVLATQCNHGLSPWHVSLFVAGLYLTHAALVLPLRPGLAAVFGAGLVCDANSPVPFGTHALLFAAGFAVIHRLRDRLPGEETAGRLAVALLANFALFFALTFLGPEPIRPAAWPRLGADLVFSQAFLILAGPWFFALQERALALADGIGQPGLRL